METSEAKIIHPSKQRRYLSWISRFVLLLGLSLLLYYGYCWGWWGRDSLLMQYIFQCGCPISSEEVRYPERVGVVVPACRHAAVRLSPSGRILYVASRVLWNDTSYLLDLQIGEKTPVSIERSTAQVFGKPTLPEGSIHFLNDTLIFHTFYGIDEYILDWATGNQYPIQQFRDLRSDAYISGDVNLSVLVEGLREATYVFLIDHSDIVALTADFLVFPERSFLVRRFDIPGDSYESDKSEQFLREQGIPYILIPAYPDYLPEVPSPDGKFVARDDGIYLAETDQKIVDGYPGIEPFDTYEGKYFSLYGWIYDSTGVIYASPSGRCLIRYWFPGMDGSNCLVKVPQPVLKLKVPQEYLPPASP